MGEFRQPKTYLVGSSAMELDGLYDYLRDTKQEDFMDSVTLAKKAGLHDGECLLSFGAKLCYKSLILGQNANVTRVRDIPDNIKGCIQAGHSSVFGHCVLNFVTTNCSRVFTHELIRHEVGTWPDIPPLEGLHEWSQTSGRYVRLDAVDIVWDDILSGCEDLGTHLLGTVEDTVYLMECRKGLRMPPPGTDCKASEYVYWRSMAPKDELGPEAQQEWQDKCRATKWVPNDKMPFDIKKKITSAIRRFAVNGQVNEILWSINLRALRHALQMRTNRHAEYEIRLVFGQVFDIVRKKFAVAFSDAKVEIVNGLPEVTGMRTQPYAPKPIAELTDDELRAEIRRRQAGGFTV